MPFNQIIDLNTSGNVGRNSYEILLMSTNVIDITLPAGAGSIPITAIESVTLPPGYLRVGDCLRASVATEYISGAGTWQSTFTVRVANDPLAGSTIDTAVSELTGGMTIGVGHVFASQTAIPNPGDAFIQRMVSYTPQPLNLNGNVLTLGQNSQFTTVNLRLPIVVGLYGEMQKTSGINVSRSRCLFYCIEVLRRAN
jgi:hypothetical protein